MANEKRKTVSTGERGVGQMAKHQQANRNIGGVIKWYLTSLSTIPDFPTFFPVSVPG
jgi:hypothetical protein